MPLTCWPTQFMILGCLPVTFLVGHRLPDPLHQPQHAAPSMHKKVKVGIQLLQPLLPLPPAQQRQQPQQACPPQELDGHIVGGEVHALILVSLQQGEALASPGRRDVRHGISSSSVLRKHLQQSTAGPNGFWLSAQGLRACCSLLAPRYQLTPGVQSSGILAQALTCRVCRPTPRLQPLDSALELLQAWAKDHQQSTGVSCSPTTCRSPQACTWHCTP